MIARPLLSRMLPFVPMPATTCRSSEPSVTRSLSSFLEPRTFRYLNLQPLLKRVFSSNQIFNFSGYGKPASSFLRAFLAAKTCFKYSSFGIEPIKDDLIACSTTNGIVV